MQVLIECGVFDDGDVAPTQVIGLWEIPRNDDGTLNLPLDWSLRDGLNGLRAAAEKEYGRAAPDHALFWAAYPKPEE